MQAFHNCLGNSTTVCTLTVPVPSLGKGEGLR